MNFIDKNLEEYVEKHTEQEPKLLTKLNKITHQTVLQPRMLSGHNQGRLLSYISKLDSPKKKLEIGTFQWISFKVKSKIIWRINQTGRQM